MNRRVERAGRSRVALAMVTAVVAVAAGACGGPFQIGKKPGEGDTPRRPPEIVIPVEAELPSVGAISDSWRTNSRVEAERKVEVTSEGTGLVLRVHVDEGDRVRQNQTLAELDKQEAQASLNQAKSQMDKNKADYDRAKISVDEGLIPESEYQAAYFTYQQSVDNFRMQEFQLQNLTIRAPFDGVVTKRNIQQGQLVSVGNPAFTVVDPQSYMLAIAVPERFLPRLREGQEASVTIDALPGERFTTRIRRINPSVNVDRPGTVKAVLDFSDEAKEKLLDSAFARVELIMDTHENAVLVAKDAVIEENGRKYIYVIRRGEPEDELEDNSPAPAEERGGERGEVLASPLDDGDLRGREDHYVAERVEVTVDFEDSHVVEIVSGLTETDLLVVNGQHTLKPGQKVRVTNVTDEILAKAGLGAAEALAAAKARQAASGDAEGVQAAEER